MFLLLGLRLDYDLISFGRKEGNPTHSTYGTVIQRTVISRCLGVSQDNGRKVSIGNRYFICIRNILNF